MQEVNRKVSRRRFLGLGGTGLVGAMLLGTAACSGSGASNYPDRPINGTIGWSAGGTSDLSARVIARELEEELDTTIQMTNNEGGNGGVAGREVAQGSVDGYEIHGGAGVHGTWPTMDQAEVGWEDFYGFIIGNSPTALYVAADSEYESIEDVVSAIEENPGELAFGNTGAGGNGELFARLLLQEAGLEGEADHIPYDGGREAAQFLQSGQVDFAAITLGDASDLAEAGDIRPVANLSADDLEVGGVEYPNVLDQYPGLEPYTALNPSYGVFMPRDTPNEIVARFGEAFLNVAESESLVNELEGRGVVVDPAVGQESDEIMARTASARTWPLWELEIAPNNPSDRNIPRIEEFEWPPNERAEDAASWPEALREGGGN